ncbi:hypothetical protein BURKHO8Y_20129 [Burkholderia sp. 8Y]|nr:hypothetical protein BURKHO8Y_20129 [Burkholderia sp. 8Y]
MWRFRDSHRSRDRVRLAVRGHAVSDGSFYAEQRRLSRATPPQQVAAASCDADAADLACYCR